MKRAPNITPTALCIVATLLTACATSSETPGEGDPRIEETRVYIQTVNPEVVSWVRYEEPLRFDPISNMHALLETEAGVYLLETERLCRALTSVDIYSDMADRRSMRGRLRAGIDTLRGCTIETIYRLPDEPAETSDGETGQNPTQEPD
ncbi:MAG: DUF6491 family protein [Woeseiaceae bacterium]|nr:DUF6491 family protein [Woeseiaceae bacterium]